MNVTYIIIFFYQSNNLELDDTDLSYKGRVRQNKIFYVSRQGKIFYVLLKNSLCFITQDFYIARIYITLIKSFFIKINNQFDLSFNMFYLLIR